MSLTIVRFELKAHIAIVKHVVRLLMDIVAERFWTSERAHWFKIGRQRATLIQQAAHLDSIVLRIFARKLLFGDFCNKISWKADLS